MTEVHTPTGNMRARVGKGAAWTAMGQFVRTATAIGQVIILSRMLAPSDFGLIAMCAPIFAFVSLFLDLGLSQATVQKDKITYAEMSFLFWINLGLAVLLAFVVLAISPLVAWFYGDERLTSLMALLSVGLVIGGFGTQQMALMNRTMRFDRLAIIAAASSVIGLAVAIVSAWYGLSYWSLIIGLQTTSIITVVSYWLSTGWIPSRPSRDVDGRELLTFGAGLTGFNFLNFFARNIDSVLIGRFWGGDELGHYDRANKLLLFPLTQVMTPISSVMVPALSRMREEPDRYRNAFIKTLSTALLLVLPGVAFATAKADMLIPFLLGPQWDDTAHIFMALGFASMLQAMNNPAGWLFISQGRSTEFFRWGVVSSATVCIGFIAGVPFGALGVAIGYALSEYIRTPLLWFYVCRQGPVTLKDIVTRVAHLPLAGLVSVGAIWSAGPLLPADVLTNLICSLLIGLAVFFGLAMLSPATRRVAGEILGMALAKIRRRGSSSSGTGGEQA